MLHPDSWIAPPKWTILPSFLSEGQHFSIWSHLTLYLNSSSELNNKLMQVSENSSCLIKPPGYAQIRGLSICWLAIRIYSFPIILMTNKFTVSLRVSQNIVPSKTLFNFAGHCGHTGTVGKRFVLNRHRILW